MRAAARLVFKDPADQATVLQDLAEREGWPVTAAELATADAPLEIVWMPDPYSIVRYVEDQNAHFVYLRLEGESADRLDRRFRDEFDVWDAADIASVAENEDPEQACAGVMLAGLSAPEHPDGVYRPILEAGLRHRAASVRARTVEALAYPAWPELRPALAALAGADPDAHVRALAGRLAGLLEGAP